MIRVPPQRLRPAHYEEMARQLESIFSAIIFEPLLDVIYEATQTRLNAADDVVRDALRSGRIQYADGIFSGKFSAAIGRALRSLGASFDARQKVYKLPAASVPGWISAEAGLFSMKAKAVNEKLKKTLGYILDSLDQAVDKHKVKANRTVDEAVASFRSAAKVLRLTPELSDDAKDRLRRDYTDNMDLWIKKFSEEMIGDLRGVVEENAMAGYRFDKLVPAIQNRYTVAASKAKFLARQETALFMSKYRQQRFGEAGISQYRWSTARDERVRDSHKKLNGKVFSYAHPPIVDSSSGRRANPGEDFNCRCIDEPILRVAVETA